MGQIIYLFVYLIISSLSVNASVVLNEVAVQPNQAVELYNTASTSADISGWYIDDAGGTTYFTVPPQTILAPQSCVVFSADFNFNKSSADTVRLFDNTSPPTTSSAKLMESYSYLKAPDVGNSFVKNSDGGTDWQINISSLGLFNESLTSCIPLPTPTPLPTEVPTQIPTTIPSPTPYTLTPTPSLTDYSNIYISEIFPYPQPNVDEWIELYNDNNVQVNLEHWYIDDGENTGSTPKSFSLTIEPYSYATIDLSSSLFNNSGDAVRLLDGNKNEKESMEYGKIVQGKSIGRISFMEDSYCEQESSKNIPNSFCILKPTQIVNTQTIKQNTTTSIQKIATPTKKIVNISNQKKTIVNGNSPKTHPMIKTSEVLGVQTQKIVHTSPIPYFSFVSFSYSLLTIVSVFIKMKNA